MSIGSGFGEASVTSPLLSEVAECKGASKPWAATVTLCEHFANDCGYGRAASYFRRPKHRYRPPAAR
jgi:hypothetical protein